MRVTSKMRRASISVARREGRKNGYDEFKNTTEDYKKMNTKFEWIVKKTAKLLEQDILIENIGMNQETINFIFPNDWKWRIWVSDKFGYHLENQDGLGEWHSVTLPTDNVKQVYKVIKSINMTFYE